MPDRPLDVPKVLWASPVCLLDTSSGASLSSREMLRQLCHRGWDVRVLGATIFDNENGIPQTVARHLVNADRSERFVEIEDAPLIHGLLRTKGHTLKSMTEDEQQLWMARYKELLDTYRPDLVFFYGGGNLRKRVVEEARSRDIACAAYVVSTSYLNNPEVFEGIDTFVTDSEATAKLYHEKLGVELSPVGKFINPANVCPEHHARARVLFINPSPAKGAVIVAALSLLLAKRRPDITFEVVQSRGNWHQSAQQAARALGMKKPGFENVVLTQNRSDMRPVYQRARLLLAPSLWWDSGPRVLVEAMLNGLPIIGTNRGGLPELVGDAGILMTLPDRIHQPPYMRLPSQQILLEMCRLIERFYDDPAFHETYSTCAKMLAEKLHGMDVSTDRLISCLLPVIQNRQS